MIEGPENEEPIAEGKTSLDDMYAISVGAFLTLHEPVSKPITNQESFLEVRRVASNAAIDKFFEVCKLVSASPIVVSEPTFEDPSGYTGFQILNDKFARRDVFQFNNALEFSVHWPEKNQQIDHYGGPPFVEDFRISYDGAIYTTTIKCEKRFVGRYSYGFGREGLRILESILYGHETVELEPLGPTPMFLVFYVVFTDDPSKFVDGDQDDNESLIFISKSETPNQTVYLDYLCDELRRGCLTNFEAQAERVEFLHHSHSLYMAHQAATSKFNEMIEPVSLLKRIKGRKFGTSTDLKKALGDAFQNFAKVEESKATCLRLARDSDERFSTHSLLSPHKGYTLSELKDVEEWNGQHILVTLRFLAEESRSHGLQFAALNGPILGAIIALGATALVLWLGGS